MEKTRWYKDKVFYQIWPRSFKDGNTVVEAEVPMAEMSSYAIDLRAMTQARGSFTLEFARYEEVPKQYQDKIIADAKADE